MKTYKNWYWGFALLLLVPPLSGCSHDAANGQPALQQEVIASDTNITLADMPQEQGVQPFTSATPAPPETAQPTNNVLEIISRTDSLTKFWSLLRKSGMAQKLNGTGPYTVFAPSDYALETRYGKSLKDLHKPEHKERLQELVSTHLLAGKLTVADLENGATLITAGGQQLRVVKSPDQLRINDAVVAAADADCRNGVVHVVDRVLETNF